MNTLTIELSDEEHRLFTELAIYLGRTPESLIRRSVDGLLGEVRTKLAMIEDGRRSGEEEGWLDGDEVLCEMDAWLADDSPASRMAAE